MTIDEAIKHCKDVAYQKDLESGFDTDYERYAMTDEERTACKECAEEHRQLAEWLKDYKRLLEQEPCEDCVSRKAVLDLVNSDWEYEGLEVPVDSLPSVTPAHKKSRWILIDEESNTWQCLRCKELGKDDYWQLNSGTPADNKMDYCPYCGAEMESEE